MALSGNVYFTVQDIPALLEINTSRDFSLTAAKIEVPGKIHGDQHSVGNVGEQLVQFCPPSLV
jgi:hypothetical protein